MNKNRRAELNNAVSLLDKVYDIVEGVKDQEEDSLDNMPENLRESERCENMEVTIDNLDDIVAQIDEVKDLINNVVEN